MTRTKNTYLALLAVLLTPMALISTPAFADLILTQDTSRGATAGVHLTNLGGQQGVAHSQVDAAHSVSQVSIFTAGSTDGIDVVYLSPHQSASSVLSAAEVSELGSFVSSGGRLVIAADHNLWAAAWANLAGFFGGIYAGGSDTGTATVTDFSTGITNGPGGVVNSFTFLSANLAINGVTSLANFGGANKLGYTTLGFGEVVFLTDFNTFDNFSLALADNQALWTNLFAYSRVTSVPEPGTLALLGIGLFGMGLSRRRKKV